jgi:hypothetical protein
MSAKVVGSSNTACMSLAKASWSSSGISSGARFAE